MINFVKTLLAILSALTAVITATPPSLPTVNNYYPNSAIVFELDYENDLVRCEDCAGMIWEFEGASDWDEGDLVSLLMDGKGTGSIFDDEVLLARYGGWIGHYGAD